MYAEAQEIYHRTDYDKDGLLEYAQSLQGLSKGPNNEDIFLIDQAFANAEAGPDRRPVPKAGYYFKVLKGQGPNAPLGQMDFVVKGAMIGGFALAAAPAQYRVTGVKTFLVGPNGVVYEKDLGPDTVKLLGSMDRYNPDKTWQPTADEWPADAASTD